MQLDFLKPEPVAEARDAEAAKRGSVGSTDWLGVYRAHLKSKQWKVIRNHMMGMAHGQCQKCGNRGGRLEVHHKTYEHLGDEFRHLGDLIVLCPDCHAFEDKLRAIEGKKKSQQALSAAIYYNGRDTYMTKKYGEQWELTHYDSEEYDNWLERKRDDYA